MLRNPLAGGIKPWAARLAVVALALLHGGAICLGLGGREGLLSEWPIWRDDHPLYFHSAMVTRRFLAQTGTTAGYDPSFMAGYAKSVVFPASSTLPELVVGAFGGSRPERAYKFYVLIAAAAVPWLVAWAARLWRAAGCTIVAAVLLFLIYFWTDFPVNYAAFGMLPYLLAIPLGLAATGVFCGYLERGGFRLWLASALLMAVVVLVHLTSAMIVVPAAGLAYVFAFPRGDQRIPGMTVARHLGVWLIPVAVLAANAFWWLPGIWLASTKGPSGFAFSHSGESVAGRLAQIATISAPIESVLWALGLVGLALLGRRDRIRAAALGGFAASGFAWGYLAGMSETLDFLQPGRHTYALYSALTVGGALGLGEVLARLRGAGGDVRLDRWAVAGMVLVGVRLFGPSTIESVRARVGGGSALPFLTSQPPPQLRWILRQVETHMKPGERLLYEEGGFDKPWLPPDPFRGGRFSGVIADRTGVELLGGPYLHASLATNFTQFGEGMLFGKKDWGRDHFERYARLYRPGYILCWSPQARGFCRANPDRVTVLDDDGTLLFGRVAGYGGGTIEGTAEVTAEPGRLVVRGARPGVDGTVVLRYHSVPCLRTVPPAWWEPVFLEGDPVPFIRIRPPPGSGSVALEIRFPPGRDDPGTSTAPRAD